MGLSLLRMLGTFCLLLALAPRAAAEELREVHPAAYAAFCTGVEATQSGRYRLALAWLERAAELDPASAEVHIELGALCAERLRDYEAARQHFEQALALDPHRFRARYGLARLHLRAGEFDKAIALMRLTLDSPEAKENPAVVARICADLGAAAELRGDLRRAAEHYARAASVAPNPIHVLLRLAYVYRAMDEHEQAAEAFLRVGRLAPEHAQVHRELCDEYKACGRWRQAFDELQAYVRHPNGPGRQEPPLREAADLAERAGLDAQARELLEELLDGLLERYEPDAAPAGLCGDVAEALVRLGRPAVARPYLEEAVRKAEDESRLPLRRKLALLYRELGMPDEAIRELAECVRAAEPRASLFYRAELCAAFEAAGRHEEARRALEAILDIPGAKAVGHAELGLFHHRRGQTDRAVEELRRAIQLADARQGVRFRIHLSLVHAEAGHDDQAEQVLIEAKRILPADPAVSNALGWFYAERGRKLDEALTLVRSALDVHPNNPYYLDTLGWVHFKQGRSRAALKPLQRAAALCREGIIWDHLGDVHMALGDEEKASFHWKRSLEFDPDLEGVREKLEKLGQHPTD